MNTLHDPSDKTPDPQAATPYFLLRRAEHRAEVVAECARRGLGTRPAGRMIRAGCAGVFPAAARPPAHGAEEAS
jgi:hypothetical protein